MKKLFTLIFVLFCSIVYAQQVVNVELEWQEVVTVKTINNLDLNYIYFEGSSINFKYGSLPIFTHKTKLSDEVYTYELEIINEVCDTLSPEIFESISDADLIPIKFEHWINKEGANSTINILPLKRHTATNQIIALLKFDILLTMVPTEEKKELLNRQPSYSENSVLAEGEWHKLGIIKSGIHKIDYDFISSMGLKPLEMDVEKIGIFGNYVGMLSEDNEDLRADDLQEYSVDFVGMEDGSFDIDDYILFYAQSQEIWSYNKHSGRFDNSKNLYADTVYYFFSPDQGNKKQINIEESLTTDPTEVVTSFVDYLIHDNDYVNLLSSGKEWVGERLSMLEPEIVFTHNIPNLINEKSIYLQFEIIGRSFENSSYKVFVNDQIIIDSTRISSVPDSEGTYARRSLRTETFFNEEEDILEVRPVYNTKLSSASAWINYYVFNFERELIFDDGQMKFRQTLTAAAGNKSRFKIRTNINNIKVWDITDCYNPLDIELIVDETVDFTLATDTLREFIAFESNSFMEPVLPQRIDNQNLHAINSVDFIIISPDVFREQADRLAQIHLEHDGLNTIVLSPEVIYNEFSSGSQDPTAIRDFMRMLYKREAFKNGYGYLLMFGDGSFDYKHRIHENTNFVPTYESTDRIISTTTTYVTDDYFGLLDDDEGVDCDGVLDIGIGRLPVKNINEAITAVDKIEKYLNKDIETVDDWTKLICFIADDGDNNLHFRQADLQLVPIVDTLHIGFNINKIYSDSYQKIKVPNGYRYPDVNLKIIDQVEKGALIINYTGHGGITGWAKESILDVPTINSFSNIKNQPLFITATCEFSRFDNPEYTSAGEHLFLNKNGGGIALLTTTRLAYAHANIILNMRVYRNLLECEDGSVPRFGDIVRMSKNPPSENFLNFMLLGDPALQLDLPKQEIEIISINNKNVSAEPDTLNALMEVSVKGFIKNSNQDIDTEFSGYIYPVVYDKVSEYQTLGNPGGSYPANFELEDKMLYKGKSTVKNGEFSFTFLVPKDISYNYGFGKISLFSFDTINFSDAWGAYENVIIGGLNNDSENDGIGPDISLFINDRGFENGNQVVNYPILIADIFDENGIYTTGNSVGRDIVAVIDEDYSNSMILNTYYNSDIDSYKKGSLNIELGKMEPGWHSLNLKAWDLMNNSSNQTIEFYVGIDDETILSDVYNFPNPFKERTTFTFKYNGTSGIDRYEIRIFDINGQYVTKLESGNSVTSTMEWNGLDRNGNKLPQGVYLYNILITDQVGNTSVMQQKLIKLSN